jgi:hypothetical protein
MYIADFGAFRHKGQQTMLNLWWELAASSLLKLPKQ